MSRGPSLAVVANPGRRRHGGPSVHHRRPRAGVHGRVHGGPPLRRRGAGSVGGRLCPRRGGRPDRRRTRCRRGGRQRRGRGAAGQPLAHARGRRPVGAHGEGLRAAVQERRARRPAAVDVPREVVRPVVRGVDVGDAGDAEQRPKDLGVPPPIGRLCCVPCVAVPCVCVCRVWTLTWPLVRAATPQCG